jgi:hypothetical protein
MTMEMEEAHSKGKILRRSEGVGTVAPRMIEGQAHEQLIGATSSSQKLPTREEPGRDWQMPLVSTGEKAPTVRPEDDENILEKLVREGVEEADHDQRVSSS